MANIYPIILNTAFEKKCLFDDYISFIWTPRYYSPGDFELCLPVTQKSLTYINKDYYVMREDDENVGIIENIDIKNDQFGNEMMIVSGRFLSAILERRIIAKQTQFNSSTVSNVVKRLIRDAITQPEIEARQISNFVYQQHVIDTPITRQFTGQNLLTTVEELAKEFGFGFKTTLSSGQFRFTLYEGIDRTYDQNENPYAVFSDKYDNLLSSEYIEHYSDQITDVLVAGEGEGLQRKTVWASKRNPTGLARYEMYKDSRNTRSNDGEIPEAEYLASLRNEGKAEITNYTKAFSGQVDFENVKYKEDIGLGDLCVIENSKWGIHVNARLIEVIESVDETGAYTLNPTFGL